MEASSSEPRGRRLPPPARPSNAEGPDVAPPPYELVAHQRRAYDKATRGDLLEAEAGLAQSDPRSSSQDSLVPEAGEQCGRRKLFLIYIHGFMGNETSFQSFPAHVHNLLAVLLAETHVVHTKIYPRYRSKGHIAIARDDLSKWLEPHESQSTDFVLLGHSMGGLVAAEVALKPPPPPASRPLMHRFLGTINFDVPFLGMHSGVIKSGLSSIFKPSEDNHDEMREANNDNSTNGESAASGSQAAAAVSRMDTLWGNMDPNFNPKFTNDVALPVRKGWRSAWHFVNKHSDDLIKSTKKLVSSHLEFGGAMANYGELKARYARIRALEEENGKLRQSVVQGGVPPRVRFINYYTASTGRTKKSSSPARPKSPTPRASRPSSIASASRTSLHSNGDRADNPGHSATGPVRLSIGSQTSDRPNAHDEELGNDLATLRVDSASRPSSRSSERKPAPSVEHAPMPVLSPPPPLGDLSYIQDPNIRKLVEDEHAKAVESYDLAIRKRDITLQNSVDKQETRQPEEASQKRTTRGKQPERPKSEASMTHREQEELRLEAERQRMAAEGRRLRGEPVPNPDSVPLLQSLNNIPRIESRTPSMPASTAGSTSTYDSNMLTPQQSTDTTYSQEANKKDRNFCNLPPKDNNGQRDPCWVRVFMENVDEVGAHCGLFFVDERYERLVGDVAERIEQWVQEDNSLRLSRAISPIPFAKRE